MSGGGSWNSHGATILQLSNFLFSTSASVGWYEVLASVHQPYKPSSQASKMFNDNSRFVLWMNERRSSESIVLDLFVLLDSVW